MIKAVEDGFVSEDVVDEAALRILRTLLAFEDNEKKEDMSVVGCQEHLNLSKKCAEEGITLLKNENLLPLENVKKIAVIGSVADIDITGDHGSSRVRPAYVVTILDGFKQYKDLEIIYDDGEDLKRAGRLLLKQKRWYWQ